MGFALCRRPLCIKLTGDWKERQDWQHFTRRTGLAELTGLPRLAEFRVQFVLSWVPFRWLGTLFGRPLGVLRHHFSEPGLPRDAQGDTWGSNHGF